MGRSLDVLLRAEIHLIGLLVSGQICLVFNVSEIDIPSGA